MSTKRSRRSCSRSPDRIDSDTDNKPGEYLTIHFPPEVWKKILQYRGFKCMLSHMPNGYNDIGCMRVIPWNSRDEPWCDLCDPANVPQKPEPEELYEHEQNDYPSDDEASPFEP